MAKVFRLVRPRPLRPPRRGDLCGKELHLGDLRYRFEDLLGFGGMGEVYLVTREMPAGKVERAAIKVVRRDAVVHLGGRPRIFLDEWRLHSFLRHPNVVRVDALFEVDRTYYLKMEYLEGSNLRSIFTLAERMGACLSEPVVCHVLSQVADALDYVHQATDGEGKPLHIVHRDVNPSNIHVVPNGDVKLLDFGLAWSIMPERQETRSSEEGFKGKLPYLSPEQVRRQLLDGRSDLFSLGCVLAEALTGRRLFPMESLPEVLDAIEHVTREYVEEHLRGVSEGLKAICHWLLAREPSARPETGKQVADALRAYARERRYPQGADLVARELVALEGPPDTGSDPEPASAPAPGTGSSRPPPVPAPEPRRGTEWGVTLAAIGVVLVAVGSLLAGLLIASPRSPRPGENSHTLPPVPPPPVPPPPAPLPATTDAGAAGAAPDRPVVPTPKTPKELKVKKEIADPSVDSRRVPIGAVAALALAAGCRVHVETNTETGDCSVMPVREVHGESFPKRLDVVVGSLNGEPCRGRRIDFGIGQGDYVAMYREPCPAGEGTIVLLPMNWRGNERRFLSRAELRGRAYVVNERGVVNVRGIGERKTTGRMRALITELRLSDGTTYPVCGVMFDAADETGFNRMVDKEGTAIYHPEVLGRPATGTPGYTSVRFYWP